MKIFFIIIKNISILLLIATIVSASLIICNKTHDEFLITLYTLAAVGYSMSKCYLEINKEINIL